MFRSAATKIAHNSTLPALAGNRDIRPLQDMITHEKAVLTSLQRLSSDLSKSNECLKLWGSGEGDDLQDVLTASSTLLGYLSSALLQMASHEAAIRQHMKSVRTMEENLDELRRQRKAVSAKADTADKKLTRMSTEHKNYQQQTELLNGLRDQIRSLDWEILTEEAKLGDFKRTSTKNWMSLKFGGLLELAEKATIVAEMGKLIIEEIPLDTTQPGQTRKFYAGYEKTEKTLTETHRCISEVVFDPQLLAPSIGVKLSGLEDRGSNSIDGLPSGVNFGSSAYVQGSNIRPPGPGPTPTTDEFGNLGDRRASHLQQSTMPMSMPSGPIRVSEDGSRIGSALGEGSASNFTSSMSPPGSPSASRFSGPGGGQFSTFPVRKATLPPSGLGAPPPPPPPPPASQSTGLQSLDGGPSFTSSFAAEVENALAYAGNQQEPMRRNTSLDGPAPSYETHDWTPSYTNNGLPRGAAPPAMDHNPWDAAHTHAAPAAPPVQPGSNVPMPHPSISMPQPHPSLHVRETEVTEDGETQLPYASPPPSEQQLPPAPGDHPNRHVRFGAGPEANEQSEATRNIPEIQERIPSPTPLNDEEAHRAAAREVSREMDMLTFNPPPGPPPRHVEHRAPSPLQPPVPPYAQRGISPPHDFGSNVTAPRSEGSFRNSQSDLRSPVIASNVESPGLQSMDNMPSSPGSTTPNPNPARPSMAVNVHSPSPSYSFNSGNASSYGTPPEMPAVQPLRTGSPASLSAAASPGTRTISAAAFKRPGIRSPSGPQSPSDSRPLPDVTPLSLRKKNSGGASLPSSPYPGSRDASPHLSQAQFHENQESQANESSRGSELENPYDVISSYSDPPPGGNSQQQDTRSPGGGYAQGRFATNLDGEGLR